LQHTATHTATHCNTHCNTLQQHSATAHCNTYVPTYSKIPNNLVGLFSIEPFYCNTLQHTLQHTLQQHTAAAHCNTFLTTHSERFGWASWHRAFEWQHTATHCNNALQQHTATTHCNSTLQHISTHPF